MYPRRCINFSEWLTFQLDCERYPFLPDGDMEMANYRRW
jgi:hypothetical protein